MAIYSLAQAAGQVIHLGLSTDTKPTAVAGQTFFSTDTGQLFLSDGVDWVPVLSLVKVASLSDLPTPSGGVIQLVDNYAYQISGTVDISPNRIACGVRNSIVGSDRLNDVLMSSTTGALVTAAAGDVTIVCSTVTLQAANGAVFDVNGAGVSAAECSLKGATLGTFTNALTCTFRQSGLISALTTSGATFSGTCAALRVFDNVVSGNAGTLFDLGTCVFQNVFIARNAVVQSGGTTFLSGAAAGANVAVAGVLDTNIFSGGGTYVSTITGTDTGWTWTGNVGVTNTAQAPAAHAASHENGGSDEVALDASQTTTGQFAMARLASGTPTGLKFVRDDGVLAVPAGGGGASATTVEPTLAATPQWRGTFTITDAAISAASKVLCWQAPGPYTGKGTRADEAELQPVLVTAVNPASGSATVYWQTPPMLTMVQEVAIGRLNQASSVAAPLSNQQNPEAWTPTRLGRVRGAVKFSYMVLA